MNGATRPERARRQYLNRRSIGTVLLLLAVLAALAFIWGNSLDSAVESSLKSGRMRELIQPLLELLVGQGNVTDHLVRKLAHFTEFAVLGALLLLLTAAAFRVRLQSVVNCLFFLTLAALTDETIQIFTGRGPQVQDVWLDVAGGTAGLLAMLALVWLLRRLFRPRKRPAADV
jgi:VanZ family protein